MKRSVKNGIMITLILLIIGIIIFTIGSIKGDNMPTGMGNPPDMQDSSNQGQMKEQPTKNNTQDSTENKSTSENKPPEKPEGEDNNDPGDMNENNNQAMEHNQSTGISSTYYFALAIEGFILSSLVMYLIMSNFNKKTWKETFETKDKIIIDLLAVTLLTTGVTYASSKVASTSNNNSEFMKENSNSSITYSSTKEITEDTTITSGTFTSTSSDENAILVSGSTATISNVTVNKTGDSNGGDNSNFYGNNSGIIAKDGANLTIDNITVTTDADGANGVFSYGGSATTNNSSSDGTTITISNSTIKTTKDNAGGIMTTGGGTMKAYNLTIETSGTSSAAIRSDRGGGTVTVDGGTYTTTGQGSPSIYSTADITVSNAELISKASEGIVIEGKNSVTIENTNLTDNNTKLNGQSTTYKNIFL